MNGSRECESRPFNRLFRCWIALVGFSLVDVVALGAENVIDGPQILRASVCRVSNQLSSASNLGSGTLIDTTADGREGLVLTCAHLFSDGVGQLEVVFANGQRHRARLVDVDYQADLAALAISSPTAAPVRIAELSATSDRLYACGYGSSGDYRCATGMSVGRATSQGQVSLMINDPVRSGDSGGGVFDTRGRLVAVVWGERDGVTYASHGRPLHAFLQRIVGRKPTVYSCPNGVCPRTPQSPPGPGRSTEDAYSARLNAMQRQLEKLGIQKQDRGNYVTRDELPDWSGFATKPQLQRLAQESEERHEILLSRSASQSVGGSNKVPGSVSSSRLDLNSPNGWAMMAVVSAASLMLGRIVAQNHGAGGRRRRRFLEASSGQE